MHLASDSCVRSVVTVGGDDDLYSAYRLLARHSISRLVVVEGEVPVGMVTEKDILRKLWAERGRSPVEIRVSEAMSSPPITISPSETIPEVARRMMENKVSSLVVVDGESLYGVITKHDLVGYASRLRFNVRVYDYMTPSPVVVRPYDSTFKALTLMREHDVGRVVVVDENARPIGMLTLKDMSRATPAATLSNIEAPGGEWPLTLSTAIVDSIMSREPIVVRYRSSLSEAAEIMYTRRISGLPVVNDEGRLVGIITKLDVVRAVAKVTLQSPARARG